MISRGSAVAVALMLTLFGVSAAADEPTSDALRSAAPEEDDVAEARDGREFLGCVHDDHECHHLAEHRGFHHHWVEHSHFGPCAHDREHHLACYGEGHHHPH